MGKLGTTDRQDREEITTRNCFDEAHLDRRFRIGLKNCLVEITSRAIVQKLSLGEERLSISRKELQIGRYLHKISRENSGKRCFLRFPFLSKLSANGNKTKTPDFFVVISNSPV